MIMMWRKDLLRCRHTNDILNFRICKLADLKISQLGGVQKLKVELRSTEPSWQQQGVRDFVQQQVCLCL